MHSYLTAVHCACCAVVHIIAARPTYSSIVAAAAEQMPFAFFLNPNQTRPLSVCRCLIHCPLALPLLSLALTLNLTPILFTLAPTVHRVPEASSTSSQSRRARPLVLFRPLPASTSASAPAIREANWSRQRIPSR
jgi:hypothetical protein